MFDLATVAHAISLLMPSPCMPQEPVVDLPKYPVAALAAAVDLPTVELRAAAADELAKRSVPLKHWLDAARSLPLRHSEAERFDEQTLRYRMRITVLGGLRDAEVLVRTPSGAPRTGPQPGPQPVLLCWHPAGGDGASSVRMWATLADRYGLLLVAPTESYEPYREQGWSYHPDGYEAMQAQLRFVRRHYDVDEDRIMLAGLRGGGHMAWDVGFRYADQFAAIVSANGSPRLGLPERDSNMIFLGSAPQMPVRSLHWGEQEPAQTNNVMRAIEVLHSFGATDANRLVCNSQLDALNPNGSGWDAFFATRRTVPNRLVKFPDRAWTPHRHDFGRHHWLEVLRYDRRVVVPFPPKVSASKWGRLDAAGQLAYLDQYLRDSLPRLQVTMSAPGEFDVEDRHIESFRLLLSEDRIGEKGKVTVRWRGHVIKMQAEPSARVFLREFVERFDRTFSPIAEVRLPK
jgi:poly(3-hydroxybutyrate) depolymerase